MDLEGAYENVSIKALFNLLLAYNFPQRLVNLLYSMYQDNKVSILTSFGPTQHINVTKGVRQGDPLSPLLFNLFINPVVERIHTEELGYELESGRQISILAFADDLVGISSSLSNLAVIWTIINKWCQDLQMNIKASKSAYTSNLKEEPASLIMHNRERVPYLQTHEAYRYLGIHLRIDLKWDTHIKRVDKKFNTILNGLI